MSAPATPYFPQLIFGNEEGGPVRAFISPHRYVQGPGTLGKLGHYLSGMNVKAAGVLVSEGGWSRFGAQLKDTLRGASVSHQKHLFCGECSLEEIDRAVGTFSESDDAPDCLIAIGGGKCADAGKAIAWRLGIPTVVVPTLASTDAPCSALSVIYSPEGVQTGVEFFPDNPALVLMDTDVILKTPPRFLVAGMADALATWYEAKVCIENPAARSTIGARPTLTAASIGKLCGETVFSAAAGSLKAMAEGRTNQALEDIVEANTLHSGLGFESGGLAGAHALASAFTIVPKVDEAVMHGEMVAMGILTQLVLEEDDAEYNRVLELFLKVGLPVHLGHVELDASEDAKTIKEIAATACQYPTMANFSFEVSEERFLNCLLEADRRGREASAGGKDAAFHALRG